MLNLIQYHGGVLKTLRVSKEPRRYFTYILSNDHKTIYVGVTGDLLARVWQHKCGKGSQFTRKHNLKKLVWFEETDQVQVAIEREKQLKRWRRSWKLALVTEHNPEWVDLSNGWYGGERDTESSSA